MEERQLSNQERDSILRLARVVADISGGLIHDQLSCLATLSIKSCRLKEAMHSGSIADAEEISNELDSDISEIYDFMKDQWRFLGSFGKNLSAIRLLSVPEFEPCLRKALSLFIRRSNCAVRIHVSGFDETFTFSHALLTGLIVPLVMNSIESISSCRGEIKRGFIVIKITALLHGKGICLTVSDNGMGWGDSLDPLRKSIRFLRPFSTHGKGRGFGLLNVNRIVTRLGGQVSLRQKQKRGAGIELQLPWP